MISKPEQPIAWQTPGPLRYLPGMLVGETNVVANAGCEFTIIAKQSVRDEERHVNARLLAAAYTTYDKHCGSRALDCAEGDLLGKLLKACRSLVGYCEDTPAGIALAKSGAPCLDIALAALASVKGDTA